MAFDTALISLASSLFGGLIVAFANHWMTKRRDYEKRLAELRVTLLIECWRKLERGALVSTSADEKSRNDAYDGMEDAIARIKLLGTLRETAMAEDVSRRLSAKEPAAVVELLNELRKNLRQELNLKMLPDMEDIFFRIHREKP
jgi:hypothetical protein